MTSPTASVRGQLEREIHNIDGDQPDRPGANLLDDKLSESMAPQRLSVILLGFFGSDRAVTGLRRNRMG